MTRESTNFKVSIIGVFDVIITVQCFFQPIWNHITRCQIQTLYRLSIKRVSK